MSSSATNCPECGRGSIVKDSRRNKIMIRRRRECVGCGFRWFTAEVQEHYLAAIKELPDLMRGLDEISSKLMAMHSNLEILADDMEINISVGTNLKRKS